VGTLLTLLVFVAADTGALLLSLSPLSGQSPWPCATIGLGSVAALVLLSWKLPRWRTALPIPWALLLLGAGVVLSSAAPDDRRVLLGSAALTLLEVGIVSAVATLFSAFSSPFLTAVFTFGVFVVGRSADTLANLPLKLFGEGVRFLGRIASHLVPNLMVYVPERPLLTGEAAGTTLGAYLAFALLHALGWIAGLLAAASLIFRRRDFL
jgi:ABC-type transport system involved in multi-copper enzyme maturation permease subunit